MNAEKNAVGRTPTEEQLDALRREVEYLELRARRQKAQQEMRGTLDDRRKGAAERRAKRAARQGEKTKA